MSNHGDEPQQPNPYGQDPHQSDPYAAPQQPDPYGQPPQQNPYGGQQQNAYGAPPASPYAQQNPYGAPASPYGAPPNPYAGVQQFAYASWGKRVGASLIDGLITAALAIVPVALLFLGGSHQVTTTDANGNQTTASVPNGSAWLLFLIGLLLPLGFLVWNRIIKQGSTGYSIGKGVLGIKLIKEATGQPVGPGTAFLRGFASWLLGTITCNVFQVIDLLWPLWDVKKQTLHDKIVGSVVIDQPKG